MATAVRAGPAFRHSARDLGFGRDYGLRVTKSGAHSSSRTEWTIRVVAWQLLSSGPVSATEPSRAHGQHRAKAALRFRASVEFTYNDRGDLLQSVRTDSSGTETTSYDYDPVGNLTAFTEHGKTATYTYDAAFRLTSLTDHTGAETTFDHDENNQRTNIAHPDGASEDRAYDDSRRLTAITTTGAADQTLLEASYSWTTSEGQDSDQLQSRTIDGEIEEFTYDGLDRLASNGETDYAYDDAGNLTSAGGEDLVYNDADQVTDARGVDGGHDEAGNTTSRGGRVLEYSLTNQFLQADEDADLATSISYDTTPTRPRCAASPTYTRASGSTGSCPTPRWASPTSPPRVSAPVSCALPTAS